MFQEFAKSSSKTPFAHHDFLARVQIRNGANSAIPHQILAQISQFPTKFWRKRLSRGTRRLQTRLVPLLPLLLFPWHVHLREQSISRFPTKVWHTFRDSPPNLAQIAIRHQNLAQISRLPTKISRKHNSKCDRGPKCTGTLPSKCTAQCDTNLINHSNQPFEPVPFQGWQK